jgi:hypothetical protein
MCNPRMMQGLAGGMASSIAPTPYSPPSPVRTNLDAAQTNMNLSPQERALYERHLGNLDGPGGVDHMDGSRSTLYQMSSDQDGRTYNVPTVWNGAIQTPNTAWQKATQAGLQTFPSYPNSGDAEARYEKMHGYMERDVPRNRDAVRTGGQQFGRAP